MTILQLRDRLISDGIASVKRAYAPDSSKQRGALAGFAVCRTLKAQEQFEAVLKERSAWEFEWKQRHYSRDPAAVSSDAWVEYRYATLQIEHVYNRLCVLWGSSVVSARAHIHVGEILIEAADDEIPRVGVNCRRCQHDGQGHITLFGDEGDGFHPLCERCWQELTPAARLPFYRQKQYLRLRRFRRYGSYGREKAKSERDKWPLIERAVLDGK